MTKPIQYKIKCKRCRDVTRMKTILGNAERSRSKLVMMLGAQDEIRWLDAHIDSAQGLLEYYEGLGCGCCYATNNPLL